MQRQLLAAAAAALVLAAAPPPARAQLELKWALEGYYRTRATSLSNLAPEPRKTITNAVTGEPIVMPDIRSTSYLTQRLRVSPSLAYGNVAKLYLQVDALDDVLYGDNNSISSAPLFAVNGSNENYMGGPPQDSIAMSRAWIEFAVPVGQLRVGRMPSHWGMGVLANGGGSFNVDPSAPPGKRRKNLDYFFDDDFGDNHFGSTNDRILFATRPLTVLRTIQKKEDTRSNLLVAYAFDKLSEAPFLPDADRRFRPFGQSGFISRGANEDDANEHVVVVLYSDPDWEQVAITDELRVGTYWVFRTEKEGFTSPQMGPPYDSPADCEDSGVDPDSDECVTSDRGSFVWVGDVWARVRYGPFYGETEVVHIGGDSTGGVPFPSANHYKKANITSGVLRAGYLTEMLDGILEVGYDSGDERLADSEFKQRPIHPDYNVGLILYEEVLRERSARVFGPNFITAANPDGARGFFTNGGVLNSKYLQLKGRFRPDFEGVRLFNPEIVGAVLFAWLDQWSDSPNVFVCPNPTETPEDCSTSKYLGTEFDLALKSRFYNEHLDFSLETGYLLFGDALQTRSNPDSGGSYANPGAPSGAFTLQARIAYVF